MHELPLVINMMYARTGYDSRVSIHHTCGRISFNVTHLRKLSFGLFFRAVIRGSERSKFTKRE